MKGMPQGGLQNMLRQANQMQKKMEKLQEELALRTYSATAGGEAVKVTVRGESKIESIVIDPKLLSTADAEMLQDLVLLACNEALKKAKDEHQAEMSKIAGGASSLLGGMF